MCRCGQGCEQYSCFVGPNCRCCNETYGDKRAQCDCIECRVARLTSDDAPVTDSTPKP